MMSAGVEPGVMYESVELDVVSSQNWMKSVMALVSASSMSQGLVLRRVFPEAEMPSSPSVVVPWVRKALTVTTPFAIAEAVPWR